jgi:hypothetical protein
MFPDITAARASWLRSAGAKITDYPTLRPQYLNAKLASSRHGKFPDAAGKDFFILNILLPSNLRDRTLHLRRLHHVTSYSSPTMGIRILRLTSFILALYFAYAREIKAHGLFLDRHLQYQSPEPVID